jgi:putative hydrolase of the HAD superfamily
MKAITYDLWNTIFQNHFYNQHRLNFFIDFLNNKGFFFSEEQIQFGFKNKFYLTGINIEDINFRHITTKERVKNLLNYLEVDLRSAEINQLIEGFESIMLEDPPPLKESVRITLEETSKTHKIGLISNTGITPGKIIERVFKKYEILPYFDVLIYSDEVGVYKPHPKIFEVALKRLKTKPEETIHVGDILETDIKGAKAFGMKTAWIGDLSNNKSNVIRPDFTIKELYEIVDILKEL